MIGAGKKPNDKQATEVKRPQEEKFSGYKQGWEDL